jgi:hypothetical protein
MWNSSPISSRINKWRYPPRGGKDLKMITIIRFITPDMVGIFPQII